MDLQAEIAVAIEILEEERKVGSGGFGAEEGLWMVLEELVEGGALERSMRDEALVGAMIDQFPAFGPGTGAWGGFVEGVGESVTTPEIGAEKGVELERVLENHGDFPGKPANEHWRI